MKSLRLAMVMVCAAGLAGGQDEPRKYTLEDCIRVGLERSATMANARRNQGVADAVIWQARSQALPHLVASAGYTRLDEVQSIDIGDDVVPMGSVDNYSAQAEVSQLLYSGGKIRAALKAATLTSQVADLGLSDTEAAMVRDIRTVFYDILMSQAAVEVRQQSLAQIQSLVDQTEVKFKNGQASEFDLITVRVRLANVTPELLNARNQWEVALEHFKRLLNATDEVFRVEGQLAFTPVDVTLESLQKEALQRRPAVRRLETALALKEQDVAAAKAEYRPSVSTFFTYNGANSYRYASYSTDWEWHWSAGAALQWNLWDGGLTAGIVRQKRLELDQMRTDYEEFEKAVLLEVKQAYLDMMYARQTVEAGNGVVALAKKALEIAKTRYDAGLATYLDYTDANLALRTAELTLNGALRDHMKAVARLDYAGGGDTAVWKRDAAR